MWWRDKGGEPGEAPEAGVGPKMGGVQAPDGGCEPGLSWVEIIALLAA